MPRDRVLLVGKAPKPKEEGLPFMGSMGRVGKFLARLCGLEFRELPYHFDFENLLDQREGSEDQPFPMREAKRRAKFVRVKGRRVVLLGHLVAVAFGLDRQFQPFTWAFKDDAAIAWIPLPNSDNAWYNLPVNREIAKQFLEALVNS